VFCLVGGLVCGGSDRFQLWFPFHACRRSLYDPSKADLRRRLTTTAKRAKEDGEKEKRVSLKGFFDEDFEGEVSDGSHGRL
jgi:hypothetical protein